MKKTLALLLALLMAISLLSACGGGEKDSGTTSQTAEQSADKAADKPAADETSDDKPLRVAFIVKTLNNPFFVDMQKGAEEAAKELGIELYFTAPEKETDIEKQIQLVENCVIDGFDAIVLSACGAVELNPSIVKANKANIPVVLVNDNIDFENLEAEGGSYVTFVGIDQEIAAGHAGKYVADNFADGAKVAILEGVAGVLAAQQRKDGFIAEFADNDKIEVVISQPANWEREQGFSVFQNMLTSNPEINVLYAGNDEMALGAVEAIEQAGLTGKITVLGFDATDDAKAAIKEGKMAGSVAQYPSDMGYQSVIAAFKTLKGETVEKQIITKTELITADKL
jgi:ribose transport system substrate-binding protein